MVRSQVPIPTRDYYFNHSGLELTCCYSNSRVPGDLISRLRWSKQTKNWTCILLVIWTTGIQIRTAHHHILISGKKQGSTFTTLRTSLGCDSSILRDWGSTRQPARPYYQHDWKPDQRVLASNSQRPLVDSLPHLWCGRQWAGDWWWQGSKVHSSPQQKKSFANYGWGWGKLHPFVKKNVLTIKNE